MPYQDFINRLRGQDQPLTLPDYDLPTQIAPVDVPKVDRIFAPPTDSKVTKAIANVEEPAPQQQTIKPQVKKKSPKRRVGTMSGTVAVKAPPTLGAFGQPTNQPSYSDKMDFRGPTQAEQMADTAMTTARRPDSRLEAIEAGQAEAKAEQRFAQPQGRIQNSRTINSGRSSLSAVTGQREAVQKQKSREKLIQGIREMSGTSLNPVNRMVGRGLAMISGAEPDVIAEALPPIGSIENAGSHFAGAAIRGATSIPEGITRFVEQNLINRDAVETYSLMNQFAEGEDKRAAKEGRPSKGDEYRKIAQAALESQTHAGDYLEPLTKAGERFSQSVLPTDPSVEGSINPLKRGFWERTMPEAAGSMAPFFVGGAAGAAAKIPQALSAGLLGIGMEIPEGYHEARDAGATPEQLSQTTDIRTLAGGLEAFGAESLMGKIGLSGKSLPGHFAKEGLQEFGQEGAQSLVEDIGDKYYSGTKPNLTAGQITENALKNAVPALFLGFGGAAMGVPQHLAERRAGQAHPVAEQIESLAVNAPDHPVVQTLQSVGIDPSTITQADDKAIEELSIRLRSMAKMDSQIQQMQGQRDLLAQQVLNAQDAQMMGRVPSTVDAQAIQQLPVVEQQLAEAMQQQEMVQQDLVQTVSPFFQNLAKATGKKEIEPLVDTADDVQGDLVKEVRKAGGINAAEGAVESGELQRLSPKEIGSTGLISRKSGEKADALRGQMVSEGLSSAETPSEFIDEVETAARRKKTETESYADYQRSQMTEEDQADSDLFDRVTADRMHPFSKVYRQLDDPKVIYTKKLAREFVETADAAGFSEGFIDRSLTEFQRQKSGESERSEATGSKPAVSLSPYKVLEANNKEVLKKLYDTNLNSAEGKAGIQELRDYAKKNGIEQRHVNAHIADIQNWQAKYGVPKNPDIQQPQATRTTLNAKSTQPARSEPAPRSGLSLEDRKLLGRKLEDVPDWEFDEYMGKVEDLFRASVKSSEMGGIDLTKGEKNAINAKLRQIQRLKALHPPKNVKQPTKEEVRAAVEKATGRRETESVPRETENVSQKEGTEALIAQKIEENGDTDKKSSKSLGTKPVGAVGDVGKENGDTDFQQKKEGKSNTPAKFPLDSGEKSQSAENPIVKQVEDALAINAPANWEGDETRERAVKNILYPILGKDREKTVTVFNALKSGMSVSDAIGSIEKSKIDEAAHEAATSPKNDLPEPTEAQIEAGNYKKGHINLHGLNITIENPEGSTRSGTDKDGKPWSVDMEAHYGYIRRTVGADEEQIDVYVGPKVDSNEVFVVDQVDAETGEFDEHKVILGAETQQEAEKLYDAHFSDGKGPDRRETITQMPVEEFKDWLKSGETTEPLASKEVEVLQPGQRTTEENQVELEGKLRSEEKLMQDQAGAWDKVFEAIGGKSATEKDWTRAEVAKAIAEGDSDSIPESQLSKFPDLYNKVIGEPSERINETKPEQLIQLVADSVDKLRKSDVFRLFDETLPRHHSELADYIEQNRPDLKTEVEEVLAELHGGTIEKADTSSTLNTGGVKGKAGDLFAESEGTVQGDARLGETVPSDKSETKNSYRDMAVREQNAIERMLESLMTAGDLTKDQAQTVYDRYKKEKLFDTKDVFNLGQMRLKDGRFLDREVIRRAAGLEEIREAEDERLIDSRGLAENGNVQGTSPTGSDKSANGSQKEPKRGRKPGSVSSESASTKRQPRKSQTSTPSLFGNAEQSETQPSNSGHAQQLVREVEAQTEELAAGEAVVQAATQELPSVVVDESPAPEPEKPAKPAKKPKAQPLATLTGASFTIGPDTIEKIQSGGAVTKYRQNVEAIKTMRQILMEGRRATVEEQETMALYAGFGGIKDLFAASGNSYADRQKWWDRQAELKELIGEEAYKAASKSTMNAHYTDPRIVQAMWTMAERLGFTKGRVLEPSMGSGNFVGLVPAHLRDKTTFTGVELDNTTGNIAKLLYPDANIHIQGFEDLKAPDGFFDLAMGNVPFGDYRISDNRYNKLLPQIHNYFFLKALDKVRPGGLVMFISSTGTMDSRRAEAVRKELAKQADLVSAIRFPAETFGKTALTSVVTDLVILRKRLPGEAAGSDSWTKTGEVNDPRGPHYPKIRLSNYFAENPSQMLGDFNGNNRMYPGRANLDRTEDFEQRLADAIANLPANVMSDYVRTAVKMQDAAGVKAKEGGYVVKDGELLQNTNGGLVPVDAAPDRIRRVEGLLGIRDAFNDLIDAEMGRKVGGPAYRKELNSAYDKFHAKYGAISDKKNREALEGDPDLPRLMALEDYDAKKKIAKKQPIFTKATVIGSRADAKPATIEEAVAKSFQSRGEIVPSVMADDLGVSEDLVADELRAKNIAFQTPSGNWELAAHYLSGNVRRKLSEARIAATTDPAFQANVDALEAIMPDDVTSGVISVEMGAPWMEPQIIADFVADLFEDQADNIRVAYDRHLGVFTVDLGRSRAKVSRQAVTTWGTADASFEDLLGLALSGKQAQIFVTYKNDYGAPQKMFSAEKTQAANTKLEAIKGRFREWVWENEDRKAKLLARYNDQFNSHVPAEYDVPFLLDEKGEGTIPGLASNYKLRKHQMSGVFRGVIEKRGLYAHEVGLGKTLLMIATASELKRLGIARKPAIAVPKKVLPGFAQTVRDAFPLLKLHIVDSRSAEKRNTTMSQVATGDHDLVLMTHDNMDMLKMKPEFEAEMLQTELDEINAVYNALKNDKKASGQSVSDKKVLAQIEKRREKLAAKIKDALNAERKDDAISFEDTGIDFLFVDEFHKYKSLPVVTALGQVKGVPTGDSQRAMNMLMRARYLQQVQNGGGLIAATGTPVSNSLVEAWIMAKFLQPDLLEEAGVQSFDAWVRQFAETVPALEMGATGEWKQVSRLSKFRNLPELQTMSRMTLDVKTAKETGILDVRPKRQDTVINVPQSDAQAAYMKVLRERANAIKRRDVEPWEDNYLVLSSDGMQMASDPRLVLPGYKQEGGKIKALADNVLRIYRDNPNTTQMVFCDTGVSPNAWGFHLYGEIINKLVGGGIPRDKIIDFSKLDSDAKVEKAVDRLNSADAVVAIGHRENMGTGVNAQKRMAAIHQFDVPWKPALVEQSEARGWRQGNENPSIEILSYVTEGSFDAVKWSTVARKQQAITAFMQKPDKGGARELEDADDDALSYDQIAAAASGDGDYLRKAELDGKVFKLSMMERAHNSEIQLRQREIPRIKDQIAAMERRAEKADLIAAQAKPIKEKEFEYKTPKGEVIEEKKEAAKNLSSNYLFAKDSKERQVIGYYKGLRAMSDGYGSTYLELPIPGHETEKLPFNVNTTEFSGTLQSIEKRISGYASDADAVHVRETVIPILQRDLEKLEAVTDSPFPYKAQLEKAKQQLSAVEKRLKAKEAESAAEGEPLHDDRGTDVRAVSALGRSVRRQLREKEIKPSDVQRILEEELPRIEAPAKDQADMWREFKRRKAEDFLASWGDDTGLAGMAITAQSAAREQALYDPELDMPLASRRTSRDVESSSEFQRWFGKSKVVDADGKPMPLYHGTQANREIEEIDPRYFASGSHFGPGFYMAESPEIASAGYAEGRLHPRGEATGSGSPSVYKVYARVEKPLDVDAKAEPAMIAAVFGSPNVDLEEMGFANPTNGTMYNQLAKRLGDDKRAANERLQELGYDGITRLNQASEKAPQHREWVIFEPNQVKSATGNRGTFDQSGNLSTARRQPEGPATELANKMDVLLHAQTIVKDRGKRGAQMFINDHARALIGAALTETTGVDATNVHSVNLSRKDLAKVADYLDEVSKTLSGEYQAGGVRLVEELRELMTNYPNQRSFNIVDFTPYERRHASDFQPDVERSVETFKGDIREENFHWSQRQVDGQSIASVGVSWAQSSKGYGKYRKALLEMGYPDNPEILAAEIAAKIAAGKFEDLGIRTDADHQQADAWLANYFERIIDRYGVEALTKFDRLLPRAKAAKEQGAKSVRERIRETVASDAAKVRGDRDGPETTGGTGQRVRQTEKSQSGNSKEAVPRRSADEAFESVKAVKGPQLPISERTNAENVRQVGEEAPEFDNRGLKRPAKAEKLFAGESVEFGENKPLPEGLGQGDLFTKDGKPRKEWGDFWTNIADVMNIPKALRASGDLSAGGRQLFLLNLPPSRWHLALKSFKKGVQASEGFGIKKGADARLLAELKKQPSYRDAVAAGLPIGRKDALSQQTELFGSRFAGKIPWAKYSEQAYVTQIDWMCLQTFDVYKRTIDKQIKDPKERFAAYEAAADWIAVASGRGSYRGRFGRWYQEKAAPIFNVFGWAPGLVYSRFQVLNPYTYAQNLKNPGSRVVFRKQMAELFQNASVLFITGALAKAAGALISTDPDEADFLKLRFGTVRYDVLAGLQQVARLGLRVGNWARTRLTEDNETEEGQKKIRKETAEIKEAMLRFGRTKLGPVPGFFVDWANNWVKVTGERHAPMDFWKPMKEGDYTKAAADFAEDPIMSQVIPLFWADMVAAWEQGWRANGTEGALKHAAMMLPAGLGFGVQDYDRPDWNKDSRKLLDKFELDPKFPKHKFDEREDDYKKRVRAHIAEQEEAIRRFSDDPNMANQPLDRQKILLKQEMSDEGRERLNKLRPEDVEDDRTVRAWIQVGLSRLKSKPEFKALSESEQEKAVRSYYGRMNTYKAQPANKQHGYQRPEIVTEGILTRKINEAIKAQE